ncbi:hypothetical protein ABKV19_004261, partial [Rosa sericea]
VTLPSGPSSCSCLSLRSQPISSLISPHLQTKKEETQSFDSKQHHHEAWGFICGSRMGFPLEFQKMERSRSSSPSTSSSSHYLSKCLLRGTVVLQVLYGHIRFPNSNDIVFGEIDRVGDNW